MPLNRDEVFSRIPFNLREAFEANDVVGVIRLTGSGSPQTVDGTAIKLTIQNPDNVVGVLVIVDHA